jgi:drug/metabolite transporter (DMT)-like permease
MPTRALALLIFLAILWSGSFTLTKVAVATVPPATLVAARLVIGAAILWVYLRMIGGRLPPLGPPWVLYALLAATGNVMPFILIGWAQTRVDSGLAAILIGTMPLITLVIAVLSGVENRVRASQIIGVGLGFLGVVVLFGPRIGDGVSGAVLAQLALIGGATCYAINVVLARRVVTDLVAITAAVILLSAAISVPISLIVDQPWRVTPSAGAMVSIFALGVLGTALGTIIFFNLVRMVGATRTSMINYLIPGMGVLWGTMFLAERPGWPELSALALIVAALALVNRRPPLEKT